MKKIIAFSYLLLFLSSSTLGQDMSGYYINWNVDHTERGIIPSIPVSREDAKIINCYFVSFNEKNQLKDVKFYYNGSPSLYSSFGAFHMSRTYQTNMFEDHFFDESGNRIKNDEGVYRILYHLNNDGYWIRKEYFDENNNLIDIKGSHSQKAAVSISTRDTDNRLISEVRLNNVGDTIPDINGFKTVHFGYNKDDYISFRKFTDASGNLINGSLGYAQVNFQCNPNGNFYEEEFRDENYELVEHPRLLFARVNFREFNKYGKYKKIYYIDEAGYPDEDRAYLALDYNSNMTINKGVFYDRNGEKTEDPRGIASFEFKYTEEGKLLRRINFNLEGEEIE